MPRIKIEFPEKIVFSTPVEVRIGDINYGGHAGNETMLTYAHEARVRFLAEHGYTELDIEGAGTIMADAAIVYRAQSFHGDVLNIDVTPADPTAHGFDLLYRLSSESSGKEVALVKTGIVFFDYKTQKPIPMPAEFRKKFFPERTGSDV